MKVITKQRKNAKTIKLSNGTMYTHEKGSNYTELVNPERRALSVICKSLGLNRKQLKRSMKKYPEFKEKVMSALSGK